jgi:hypothetical protein
VFLETSFAIERMASSVLTVSFGITTNCNRFLASHHYNRLLSSLRSFTKDFIPIRHNVELLEALRRTDTRSHETYGSKHLSLDNLISFCVQTRDPVMLVQDKIKGQFIDVLNNIRSKVFVFRSVDESMNERETLYARRKG